MEYNDQYKNIEKFVCSLCGLDTAVQLGLQSWGRLTIFQNLNHKTEGFNPQLVSLLIEEMKQAKAEVDGYPYAEKPDYYQNCEPYRVALQMLADEVAKAQPDSSTQSGIELPDELDTPRAREYFTRAMEKGYLSKTPTGYKWGNGQRGDKARLAYFLLKVFCPTNTEDLPERKLNALFGVERIGSAANKLNDNKQPPKWQAQLDNEIFCE